MGTVPLGPRARSESQAPTSWGACRQGWTRFNADQVSVDAAACSRTATKLGPGRAYRQAFKSLSTQVNVERDFFVRPPKATVTVPVS